MCQEIEMILKIFNNTSMAWVSDNQSGYLASQNRYIGWMSSPLYIAEGTKSQRVYLTLFMDIF